MNRKNRAPHVLSATAVLLLLGGSLTARLLARDPVPAPRPIRVVKEIAPVPGRATIPAPPPVDASKLEVPCWSCPEADHWGIRFRTDLDLLAPLGNGTTNAGLWLKDFARQSGARAGEMEAVRKRRGVTYQDIGPVLPPDDPLLLEAEPWTEQAEMRFYPEVYPIEGYTTQIANLLLPITLARSWVSRGRQNPDDGRAMEDFRKAVRMGRLLRQEDAILLNDLVGLACIRLGAEAIYERARRAGDLPRAMAAALVLGEVAPQRLKTAEVVTKANLGAFLRKGLFGGTSLEMPDSRLDALLAQAGSAKDRRFRGEAILALGGVHRLGSAAQKEKTQALLDRLAKENDAVIAALAAWSRDKMPEEGFENVWPG